MRKFWIGTLVYVTVVGGIIGGAAAAFNAVIGMPTRGASKEIVAQMEPIQKTSGKWTPIEIKRESTTPVAPPLPPYVAPRLAAANAATTIKQPQIIAPERKVAERKPVKRVVVAQRYAPQERQMVAAYAAPEPPRFFGPFRMGF